MDACLTDWNREVERKSIGNSVAENELMELLWHNGEVVLNSQNNKKSSFDDSTAKFNKQEAHHHNKHGQSTPINHVVDEETASWIHCPIDEAFEKEFCCNLFSSAEIPSVENNEEAVFKFGGPLNYSQISLPPPRISSFNSPEQRGCKKTIDCKKTIPENSAMTIGSSHCGSNQVPENSVMKLRMVDRKNCDGKWKFSPQSESTERETTREQPITSSSGGSGNSFWKTNNTSNETSNLKKRKSKEIEESECQSDAPESELATGNKPSQKSGTTRRSRVAEVHNLSERKRRDRINEKMKALQELIPHSNKSDKASMLDEAIEYMKSLQLQLQLMWMGTGMAPMMNPIMQQYMARLGMLPQIQNLMRMNMAQPNMNNQATNTTPQNPMFNIPVNFQNPQMQNQAFTHQQYANYMNFHAMQNNTSQAVNMFNMGTHLAQQNQAVAQPNNRNGSN